MDNLLLCATCAKGLLLTMFGPDTSDIVWSLSVKMGIFVASNNQTVTFRYDGKRSCVSYFLPLLWALSYKTLLCVLLEGLNEQPFTIVWFGGLVGSDKDNRFFGVFQLVKSPKGVKVLHFSVQLAQTVRPVEGRT